MTRRVDITIDEIVLGGPSGLRIPDPIRLSDAIGVRLAELVAERGLPERREAGPVTVRVERGLEDALAEAIWSGIGEVRP